MVLPKAHLRRFLRNEDGSLIVFGLFIFMTLLGIAGLAIDVMRVEQQRAKAQATLDAALIAASSIEQTVDAETVVRDYFEKAGLDPDLVTVNSTDEFVNDTTLVGRSVQASFSLDTKPIFLRMLGIDTLPVQAAGAAEEGTSVLEISLVLDISASMNDDGKLTKLKAAAKDFVATILENNNPENVAISIVPYNHQVYMTDDLRDHMQAMGKLDVWNKTYPGPYRPGELKSVEYLDDASRCAHFWGDDWNTRALTDRAELTMSAIFVDPLFTHSLNGETNAPYETPKDFSFWCNDVNAQMLLFENDAARLDAYIDALWANEGTSIDIGMKWGIGLLDPAMQPIVQHMIAADDLPERLSGLPASYDDNDTKKYVVLMSDGVNDTSLDVKWWVKVDRSRVWFSETAAAAGTEFDGFFVEMPDNDDAQHWYVPGSPTSTDDDQFVDVDALPEDAVQWTYKQIYRRFTMNDAAMFFFKHSGDIQAYIDHLSYHERNWQGWKDTLLENACNAAKWNRSMTIFTVAFEAPAHGVDVLQDCATSEAHHFDVDGESIADAFNTIALNISVLRLPH